MELFLALFFIYTWGLIWTVGYVLDKKISKIKEYFEPKAPKITEMPNIYEALKDIDFEIEVKNLDE
jgi:hypothetical protein